MGVLERAWEPLGLWRTRALWRGFGACQLVFLVCVYGSSSLPRMLQLTELAFLALGACALCSLLLGPRLPLLAASFALALVCFGMVLAEVSVLTSFPGAEWTMWLALPLTACVATLTSTFARGGHDAAAGTEDARRAELDWAHVTAFRLMCSVVMGFAALHKLNSDFFDPNVSCMALHERLHDYWNLPAWVGSMVGPHHIVAAELLAPLLLWLAPAVGMPLTILLVAMFASIGAPGFAGMVVVMALAFLPNDAGAVLAQALRKRAYVLVLIALAIAAGSGIYQGEIPWISVAMGQAVVALGLFCSVVYGWDAWQRRRAGHPRKLADDALAPRAPVRACLGAMVLLLACNSLTPYLGLKFQYSFAMLSNLRVDDERWNSLVFPRAMRLTEHDPYVHITKARYRKLDTGQVFDQGALLDPGLYLPQVVRLRLQRALLKGVVVTFDFTYAGKPHTYAESADPTQLYALLESLPDTPWFQKQLDRGPQSCVH